MKKLIFVILALSLIWPVWLSAKIGVGVGTGKIKVDQALKPGLIYILPSLTVLNTGDEASAYGVAIQHREDQNELKPPKEWFSFEPETFYLEPDHVQVVTIKLSLPVKDVVPGDYFAFLQGYPLRKTETSGTNIGVAAAAKLYFTVSPASFLSGLYYRLASLIELAAPWSYVVLGVLAFSILLVVMRRFFSFNIGINVKKKEK